jgi:pimeloyl-ACP methyl ester carboxylesterase
MSNRHFITIAIAILAATSSSSASVHRAPARTDNAVLHVQVTGHGRPMILIPGLASSGEVWNDAVARAKSKYECHVVTLGGFAGQPRFEGPFLDTARDSLLAYIRAHHLRAPVVVGHSLGGVLALELGVTAPDEVGPLVIVDALPFLGGSGQAGATVESARAQWQPIHDMLAGQTQENYAAFQRTSPYLKEMVTSPENLARVTDWGVHSDHLSVADAMFDVGTVDLRDQVDRIHTPVLVLGTWYGMRAMTTRAAVDSTFHAQFARVPRCSIALADSARHFVMLDAPDWTWTQLDQFLSASAGTSKR